MRKSAKRQLVLILALVFGAVFALKYMKKPPKEVVKIVQEATKPEVPPKDLVRVMVASRDLDVGDKLTYYNVKWKEIEKDDVFPGFITSNNSRRYLGKKTLSISVAKDEFIDSNSLSDIESHWSRVRPGMAVKSINMSVNHGIGAILEPGMSVRILYQEEDKNASIVDDAKVILVKGRKDPKKRENAESSANALQNLSSQLGQNLTSQLGQNLNSGTKQQSQEKKQDEPKKDEEVFVEVTPQIAQMLSLPHKGKFTLIPIKDHPKIIKPNLYYRVGDVKNMLFDNQEQQEDRFVVKSIRGDKVEYIDLTNNINKNMLNFKPSLNSNKTIAKAPSRNMRMPIRSRTLQEEEMLEPEFKSNTKAVIRFPKTELVPIEKEMLEPELESNKQEAARLPKTEEEIFNPELADNMQKVDMLMQHTHMPHHFLDQPGAPYFLDMSIYPQELLMHSKYYGEPSSIDYNLIFSDFSGQAPYMLEHYVINFKE